MTTTAFNREANNSTTLSLLLGSNDGKEHVKGNLDRVVPELRRARVVLCQVFQDRRKAWAIHTYKLVFLPRLDQRVAPLAAWRKTGAKPRAALLLLSWVPY